MADILKQFDESCGSPHGKKKMREDDVEERKLTKDEMSDREDYVKGMKKNKKDFKKRYGKDAESVMYATATKMAKEGVNESEENKVEEKKQENVQAEERQQDLNWLEDIKRLSGLENTYENSADAMKEYKVDESTEQEAEVIKESAEQIDEGDGIYHPCTKSFKHAKFGEGTVLHGEHTLSESGEVSHYDASFVREDGSKFIVRNIPVRNMIDPVVESHMHKKKKSNEDVTEEEQVDEVMPFVKMTYKEIQDDIKSTRLEMELGDEEDVDMLKPRLRDLLDMKDVVKVILNNKGWDTGYIVGAMMDSGLDTSVREELAEKFKKQVSKDPQLAKKLFKDPQVDEASGVRKEKKGKVDKSEKKHYHCKLTKDGETKGVRMVKDEDESEDDLKARCKRENMGWKLESMRKLDESFEMEGKKKYDHDGDGDIDSDDYMAHRDMVIKREIAKKKGEVEEGLSELADLMALAGLEGKVELDELANEPGQGTEETTTYSVSDVTDQGNDLHAKSKQHADKAKLGDNPMATEEVDVVENKLWKAYQAELEGVKK